MRFLKFLSLALGALGLLVLGSRPPVETPRPPRLRF
jgi:hypothetical protein